MNEYRIIADDEPGFTHAFDGEPQINLTFEHNGKVYKVLTRAHDEDVPTPTIHAALV